MRVLSAECLYPYDIAAAVGSLTIFETLTPQDLPARMVAVLWKSLKYAGTVMTASSTFSPVVLSASSMRCFRSIELRSSAV